MDSWLLGHEKGKKNITKNNRGEMEKNINIKHDYRQEYRKYDSVLTGNLSSDCWNLYAAAAGYKGMLDTLEGLMSLINGSLHITRVFVL